MKKTSLSLIALFAALQFSYAQWNTSGTNIYNSNSGHVGIGTASPVGKFDVRGNAFIGTNDLSIGSAGSFVQIDQGAGTGNTYTQIRAFSNGGNLANNLILQNSGGGVGIGTTTIPNGYKLAVNGAAVATSMKVKLYANWPDFVFLKDYKLPTLTEVKNYIDKNQHLPDIPSANEVHKNGLDLGEMNRLLLKKVEELTLYLIEKDHQLDKQQQINQTQEEQIRLIQKQLNEINRTLKQ